MPRISVRDGTSVLLTNSESDIEWIFHNNKKWVSLMLERDPDYFSRCAEIQKPRFLWLGCSDSRVVAEAATGLSAGDVFVHRNVGNVLSHSDTNAMSALEYSVKALGVKHIMVCGHTNCGAIKAALTLPSSSALITNCWISQIRDIRNHHVDELMGLSLADQVAKLVKINVGKQVFNVCTSPVVQQMWSAGSEVYVHGMLYDLSNGHLERLAGPICGNSQVPETVSGSGSFPDSQELQGRNMEDMLQRIAGELRQNPSFRKLSTDPGGMQRASLEIVRNLNVHTSEEGEAHDGAPPKPPMCRPPINDSFAAPSSSLQTPGSSANGVASATRSGPSQTGSAATENGGAITHGSMSSTTSAPEGAKAAADSTRQDPEDAEAVAAMLDALRRASMSPSSRERTMDSELLQQMMSHMAFEEAAKGGDS